MSHGRSAKPISYIKGHRRSHASHPFDLDDPYISEIWFELVCFKCHLVEIVV